MKCPEAAAAIRALTRGLCEMGGRDRPRTLADAGGLSGGGQKHRFDPLYLGTHLAGGMETTPNEDGYLLLINVAIRPAYQGRGLGRRLLELADELAASANLEGVRLYTNKLFARNIQP